MADDRFQKIIAHFRASASTPPNVDGQREEQITRSVNQSQTVQQPRRRPRLTLSLMDSDSDSDEQLEAEDDGVDGLASTPVTSQPGHATSVGGLQRPNAVAGEPITLVVTDLNMLQCSICHKPLSTRIFMCDDGHTSCSTCRILSQKMCSSCFVPKILNPCRGMEKLIKSLQVECKNKKYGCEETFMYHKKSEHENTCPHVLCFCPYSSCDVAGSSKFLYDHFIRHRPIPFCFDTGFLLFVQTDQRYVFLQEVNERVIFVVNHEVQEHGRVFNVDCIGPAIFKNAFVYRLAVKFMVACLSMESVPKVYTKWEAHPPEINYLTIPSRFTGFNMEVCIKKVHRVE